MHPRISRWPKGPIRKSFSYSILLRYKKVLECDKGRYSEKNPKVYIWPDRTCQQRPHGVMKTLSLVKESSERYIQNQLG